MCIGCLKGVWSKLRCTEKWHFGGRHPVFLWSRRCDTMLPMTLPFERVKISLTSAYLIRIIWVRVLLRGLIMKITTWIAAAAIALLGTAATAATVQLTADTTAAIGTVPGQDFVPQLTAVGATTLYSGNMSLITSGPVNLTFTLVGAESGFQNSLLFGGSSVITEFANGAAADFATGAFGNNGNPNTFSTSFGGGDLASVLSFEAYDFSTATTCRSALQTTSSASSQTRQYRCADLVLSCSG